MPQNRYNDHDTRGTVGRSEGILHLKKMKKHIRCIFGRRRRIKTIPEEGVTPAGDGGQALAEEDVGAPVQLCLQRQHILQV